MKRGLLTLAVLTMTVFAVGCAITDYDGFGNHKTTAEAKLLGKEIAFTGFGPALDGTYAYTVKYDNSPNGSGAVTINSYRNAGIVSFTRDFQIDQDGDDVQGSGGTAGGKFLPQWIYEDAVKGSCGFSANKQKLDKSKGAGPGVLLCIGGAVEEVDKDFELHASFGSLDELFGSIWSGALSEQFTLEVTGITLNGATYPVDTFAIGIAHNGLRPGRFAIANGPGLASAIQAILDNTAHMVPVTVGLSFAGGLTVAAPSGITVAFNHDALWSAL